MMNYGPTYETPEGFEELVDGYDFSFRLGPEDTKRYYDNRDFQFRNPRKVYEIAGLYEYPSQPQPWSTVRRLGLAGDQY